MWAGSVLVPVQVPDLDLDQVLDLDLDQVLDLDIELYKNGRTLQLENLERRLAQFPKSWQINSRSMYEKINRV